MGRHYSLDLLDAMERNKQEVEYKGVKILVKPIPEGGEDGDMDPRIIASTKKKLEMQKNAPEKVLSKEEEILAMRTFFNTYRGDSIVSEGVDIEHILVDSTDNYKVPVRVYRRAESEEKRPVMVYSHGGGFAGGSPAVLEEFCKLLVSKLDCVIFNIDYRLCPENSYPQPLDDCWNTLKWAYDNVEKYGGDPEKIVVAGDSAGGNLAAALTLKDREERTKMVKGQILAYPAVNMCGKETKFYHGIDPTLYRHSKEQGELLDISLAMTAKIVGEDSNAGLIERYVQGKIDPSHIYLSPLQDDMHDVPPTLLIFGEHDFLAFEDFAYAQTLNAAGRYVKTLIYRGMQHGFINEIGVTPQAEDSVNEIASFIRACFSI